MGLAQVQRDAAAKAKAIHVAAVAMAMEKPRTTQEQMRKAFEQARNEPGGIEAFAARFGEDEAVKQGALLVKRSER